MATTAAFRTARLMVFAACLIAGFVPTRGQEDLAAVATVDEALLRAAELRAEIARHDELYFKYAAPEISDFAYDQLKRELAELERAYPEAAESALEPATGDDRTGDFPTRRHGQPMLSLEKAYTKNELHAFHDRIVRQLGHADFDYIVEPKVDGMAISVTYRDGKLFSAVTRGNGIEGDDITLNALTIRSLPRALNRTAPDGSEHPVPSLIELRGEIHLTWDAFARLNEQRAAVGEPPFAHPRNLAAGSAKQLDPSEAAARPLDLVFFGAGACEPAGDRPATLHEFRTLLQRWGVPVVTPVRAARGFDELWAAVREFEQRKSELAIPMDGVVAKLDSIDAQARLGATREGPRWAVAYKFAPDRAETTLRAITVQVGRTGILTPVAELDPVELAGSTIARASLHNRAVIARLDLHIGDRVWIARAGEIIPEIVAVNREHRSAGATPFTFPEACPVCAAAVAATDDSVAVYCSNASCPAQLRRRLEHFASSSCVAIDGLGPATIEVLVVRGDVRSVADLYELQKADLLLLENMSETVIDNLINAIDRSKQAELWRFIHGLGIRHVGPVTARRLAMNFGSLDELADASIEDLEAIGAVGPETARNIATFFANSRNRALVVRLHQAGVRPRQTEFPPSGDLDGKVFVLTGTLPNLSRAAATELIEAAGGIVRSEVSHNTEFLVVGENPGSKVERARELGVTIIDEAGLRIQLGSD